MEKYYGSVLEQNLFRRTVTIQFILNFPSKENDNDCHNNNPDPANFQAEITLTKYAAFMVINQLNI